MSPRAGTLVAVARLADVPPGTALPVRAAGHDLLLVNDGSEITAFAAACTHAGGPLSEGHLAGCVLVCPWHGAAFDTRSGAPRRGPARKALRSYEVAVGGDTVSVRIEPPRV